MPLKLAVEQSKTASGDLVVSVGHDLIDEYLVFLAGRARPNSVLAAAFDLKVFFTWAQKEPSKITSRDVVNFIAAQRAPKQTKMVRISDGGSGLSARTDCANRMSCPLVIGSASVPAPMALGLAIDRSMRLAQGSHDLSDAPHHGPGVIAKNGYPPATPQLEDTIMFATGERYAVLTHARQPVHLALPHPQPRRGNHGMFGIVTTLVVKESGPR